MTNEEQDRVLSKAAMVLMDYTNDFGAVKGHRTYKIALILLAPLFAKIAALEAERDLALGNADDVYKRLMGKVERMEKLIRTVSGKRLDATVKLDKARANREAPLSDALTVLGILETEDETLLANNQTLEQTIVDIASYLGCAGDNGAILRAIEARRQRLVEDDAMITRARVAFAMWPYARRDVLEAALGKDDVNE